MAAATPNRTEILLSLPNPFTPMAFLPPDLAWQLTVGTYWLVGSLAVLIWDILSNLHNDYTLLTKYPLKLSMVVYCISRISCLSYITSLAVYTTAPLSDCSWSGPMHVLYLFTIPSTYLLFYFRVCALYYNNKFVKAFFFISWLGVLGSSILPILGVHGTRLGLSNFCIGRKLPSYVALAALFPLINDTLVYCATTYALLRNSHVDGVQNGFKVMVFGNQLPALSRAILQDGQAYYLTTLGLAVTTSVMIYSPGVSPIYASLIGVPNVVLVNCMTCLVYRKVRFGLFRETAATRGVLASGDRTGGTHGTRPTAVSLKSNIKGAQSIQIFTTRHEEQHHDEDKFQLDDLPGSKSDVNTDVEGRLKQDISIV